MAKRFSVVYFSTNTWTSFYDSPYIDFVDTPSLKIYMSSLRVKTAYIPMKISFWIDISGICFGCFEYFFLDSLVTSLKIFFIRLRIAINYWRSIQNHPLEFYRINPKTTTYQIDYSNSPHRSSASATKTTAATSRATKLQSSLRRWRPFVCCQWRRRRGWNSQVSIDARGTIDGRNWWRETQALSWESYQRGWLVNCQDWVYR